MADTLVVRPRLSVTLVLALWRDIGVRTRKLYGCYRTCVRVRCGSGERRSGSPCEAAASEKPLLLRHRDLGLGEFLAGLPQTSEGCASSGRRCVLKWWTDKVDQGSKGHADALEGDQGALEEVDDGLLGPGLGLHQENERLGRDGTSQGGHSTFFERFSSSLCIECVIIGEQITGRVPAGARGGHARRRP